MVASKSKIVAAGFSVFRLTGLHHLTAPWTRGAGVILMFHQVRPWIERDFAPNRLLEITPDFLDSALSRLKKLGFEIVSLETALARLKAPAQRRFAVLTFDGGYRDTHDYALPLLEKHHAPFMLYVTTGFAQRSAHMWWIELEQAIRVLPEIEVEIGSTPMRWTTVTTTQKLAAFSTLQQLLRSSGEIELAEVMNGLCAKAGIDSAALVDDLCLDWAGIKALARHPLCTIGVHTLNHPRLAKRDADFVRFELAESRRLIEAHIDKPSPHLAFPIGDPTSAGRREFTMAHELGFASAVSARSGMIFPEHLAHKCSLPRLSINGDWQDLDAFEFLISGAPFVFGNKGRRVA